ncbi:hypothetical protein ACFL2V_12090 [Pseudomonadota bacterium]
MPTKTDGNRKPSVYAVSVDTVSTTRIEGSYDLTGETLSGKYTAHMGEQDADFSVSMIHYADLKTGTKITHDGY